MKNLKNKFSISYRWWRVDNREIEETDQNDLERLAMDIILFQLKLGYVEGEMSTTVQHIQSSHYIDGTCTSNSMVDVEYRGHWKKE